MTVPLNVPNLVKGSARLAKIWAQLLLLVSRRLFPITHQAGGLAGGVCWGRAGWHRGATRAAAEASQGWGVSWRSRRGKRGTRGGVGGCGEGLRGVAGWHQRSACSEVTSPMQPTGFRVFLGDCYSWIMVMEGSGMSWAIPQHFSMI